MRIFDSVKPVIAAVNGVAAGVGATMQLPMDVRIASADARFGFVFTRRGIVPESASSWFLPRLVGISRALRWCYSGEVFGAAEALEAGLVSAMVAADELMAAARTEARHASPPARRPSRRALAHATDAVADARDRQHPVTAHRMEERSALIPARRVGGRARRRRRLPGKTRAGISGSRVGRFAGGLTFPRHRPIRGRPHARRKPLPS
ncbi:enoyl-CoA hydratase-related protein [Sphingomonas sp. MMS24-JH45]